MRIQRAHAAEALKKHGSFALFILVAFTSWLKLLATGPSLHFDFFRQSARLIWAGQTPYGLEYPAGFFLYSPSCAYFFYGAFAFFPYTLGLALYMLSSTLLLIYGARRLWRVLYTQQLFALPTKPRFFSAPSLFYFLLSSELIGTLLNARIEIFICAIVLLATSFILEQRREGLAYFLLAMVCNFKMQSFPTVGLLLLIALRQKNWRAPLTFLLSLVFWYLAPLLVAPAEFVMANYTLWRSFFAPYLEAGWLDFQHLFRFLHKTFSFVPSYRAFQVTGVLTGLAFAVYLGFREWRLPQRSHGLLATGLGASFVLLFSPMGQSAAFILYAPLLIAVLYIREQRPSRGLNVALAAGYFFISLCYSDFVPKWSREIFFDYAVKSLGIFILTLSLFFWPDKSRAPATIT